MNKMEYMPVDCLQVPKVLFQMEKYKNLSNTAKILYSLFLDRLKFAVQNSWVDGKGDLYVIYPKSEMKKDLNTTRYGVDQAVQELVEIGNLVRIIPNNGKANHFYINDIYENGTALQKKVASTFLETFLFYSGFFTPLYYLGNNKLANVAEIIKLIIRDESVHGTYIGYKFQLGFNELSEKEQDDLRDWMYDLLYQLYENEENYTKTLYDQVGWTEEVLTFLRYNANKALMNLGQDPLFPDTANDVNPIVMNGISTGTSNHDFFSQIGNGYLLGSVEAMQDDDYNYGLD